MRRSSTAQSCRAEPTVASHRRVLNYRLGDGSVRRLTTESRRALALFRALDLVADTAGVRALLTYCGRDGGSEQTPQISEADCAALADVLRSRGYPLTDQGITAFKAENELSAVVRIGPHVAAAYAEMARRQPVRLGVSGGQLSRFPAPHRRAIDLLLLIGRCRETLAAVGERVGVQCRTPARPVVAVERGFAARLLAWMEERGWRLDDEGLARLCRAAGIAPAAVGAELATFVADAVLERDEPAHDYTRHTRGEHTLSARTIAMLGVAQRELGDACRLRVIKGSYEAGQDRGAHPHNGGGVVDVSVRELSPEVVGAVVCALRAAGFAAWYRPREDRPHVHAVAIGDREMSPAAQWQVKGYFSGLDGRSRMEPDPHGDLAVKTPGWVARYRVSFA